MTDSFQHISERPVVPVGLPASLYTGATVAGGGGGSPVLLELEGDYLLSSLITSIAIQGQASTSNTTGDIYLYGAN